MCSSTIGYMCNRHILYAVGACTTTKPCYVTHTHTCSQHTSHTITCTWGHHAPHPHLCRHACTHADNTHTKILLPPTHPHTHIPTTHKQTHPTQTHMHTQHTTHITHTRTHTHTQHTHTHTLSTHTHTQHTTRITHTWTHTHTLSTHTHTHTHTHTQHTRTHTAHTTTSILATHNLQCSSSSNYNYFTDRNLLDKRQADIKDECLKLWKVRTRSKGHHGDHSRIACLLCTVIQ